MILWVLIAFWEAGLPEQLRWSHFRAPQAVHRQCGSATDLLRAWPLYSASLLSSSVDLNQGVLGQGWLLLRKPSGSGASRHNRDTSSTLSKQHIPGAALSVPVLSPLAAAGAHIIIGAVAAVVGVTEVLFVLWAPFQFLLTLSCFYH